MMMEKIEAQGMVWLLVRIKRRQVGGIRTVTVGGDFETYRDRAGRARQRRITGTGDRVFLPEHLLRRAGFEVFLPVKKVWRRKNRFSPERVCVAQPLLVDWMFVGWPADQNRWADLMALDVVMGVMGTGGRPIVMKPATVISLMRRWGGGMLSPECHQMVKRSHEFEAGQVARIAAGPFQDFEAKVVEVDGPNIRVMLDLFGRETPAQFDWRELLPVPGDAR
ncbi:transcription termination/antitermination protein NusG [Thalassovita aquimarina]|uniref:KOW domain-containing protein n=1 Tax=Thalassovita aquimarina TaxID=2785917 RepID=A0ABS5HSH6_9RHOB|nr:transcription termination/antitermination NusG family protein [Thalassovita aquimarina]MBR9651901.1 hypothetical protein [Thalassovita aquimarina]